MRKSLELKRYGLLWEIEFSYSYQEEVNGGLPENSYPEYFDYEVINVEIKIVSIDIVITYIDGNELFDKLDYDDFFEPFALKTLLLES